MMGDAVASKTELRQSSLARRRSLGQTKLEVLSKAIEDNLFTLREFLEAKTVAAYVAKEDEVQTKSIIERVLAQGKRVLVPTTDRVAHRLVFSELTDYEKELSLGHYGVPEPKPEFVRKSQLEDADVALVPIVVCDDRGYRIGYGGGYFDSALRMLTQRTLTVGLALEAQFIPRVPETHHDVPLRVIVTERRVVRPGGS